MFVHTNACFDLTPIDHPYVLAFFRNVFTFRPEYESFFVKNLPNRPYEVLHLRMGDQHMANGTSAVSSWPEIDYLVMAYSKPGTIVCADSVKVRQYVRERHPQLQVIMNLQDAHSMHKGPLLGTLLDLYLVTRAQKVHSYSVYWWNSGFVKWIAMAFGVQAQTIHYNKSLRNQFMQWLYSRWSFSNYV